MIMITGAAGFIGSAWAAYLNRLGYTDLYLVDRLGESEKWKNLLGLKYKRFIDRNHLIEQIEAKEDWFDSIDTIFHFGANADTTLLDGDFFLEWNVNYSIKLCNWAVSRGVRFYYASSAAVYGDGSLGFSDNPEITHKLRPLNPYGFSKWMFDLYVIENQLLDKVTGFRFFNVYGPNEYHKGRMASVVLHAYPQVVNEKKLKLFQSHKPEINHGEQKRDFIYIDEVLRAIEFSFKNHQVKGILNLGTGIPHSFNQLAESVFSALKTPLNIEYIPTPENLRERYQYYTCADMSSWKNYNYPLYQDNFQRNVTNYVTEYLFKHKHYSEQNESSNHE